jgi:uncharacterized protein (DUF983 family)
VSTNSELALAILAAFGTLGLLSMMGAYLIIGMAWDKSSKRPVPGTADGQRPSGWTLTWRAVMLRCPACGRGPIFASAFRMAEKCSVCGTVFWRNEGEWLGPAILDYTTAMGAGLVAWALLVFAGASPAVQLAVACAAATFAAIFLSRWSRSIWTLFLYISDEAEPDQRQIR